MAFNVVICVAALLVQAISGQNCGCSCGCGVSIPSSGGELLITSIGPLSPSGISVNSNLDLNGNLDVEGALPFLSAVEFQGSYDTSGAGCLDYSCGACGNVAINSVIGGSSGCGCGCSCRG